MVVDTSALLAVLFAEPQAQSIAKILSASDLLLMSAVNYTECLIRVLDRAPDSAEARRWNALPKIHRTQPNP